MQIRFDVDFDGYPWPGPLGGERATFGKVWTGPRGLLGILETQLGLGCPSTSDVVRAAALVPMIRETAGFWSASAIVDPVGVARALLSWRDVLWSCGWRGEAVSPRLADLAKLPQVLPGMPDRLDRVADHIPKRKTDVRSIELVEKRSHYSRSWQTIFSALQATGTQIIEVIAPDTQAAGDLQASRSRGFVPTGDGTLQLLRPQGPQLAADALAAWLTTVRDRKSVVVISADPLLDAALCRYGLPTIGAVSARSDNSLLEILPLVIQMGWSPPDPARALELMTLPLSPIPRGIGSRLVAALKEWPAVDSDAWREALNKGLEAIDEPERRKRTAERLAMLLQPTVTGIQFPSAELKRCVNALTSWFQGMLAARKEIETENEHLGVEAFEAALIQCSNFVRLLELIRLDGLTRPQLQRLIEDATDDVPPVPRLPAQAGLFGVATPGAICAPVDHAVWWNFTRDSSSKPETLPLNTAERLALAAAGVNLPEPAQVSVGMNARWGRPLKFTRSSLMLVCPKTGDDGNPQHPHPVWDQIAAHAKSASALKVLDVGVPLFLKPPDRKNHDLLAMPQPRREWRLPKGTVIPPREIESPSGAGALVGCPFHWTLRYAGKVSGGDTAELPSGEQLVGLVAHEILARLLLSNIKDPQLAEREAERLFDVDGPRMAATLFMPGSEKLKQKSRRATARSAKVLFAYLRDAKLGVVSVEQPYKGKAFGTGFEGRPDVIVGPPNAVIDLKWDGEKYHKSALELGAAFQLAAYSQLVRADGPTPPVAFFIIRTQRMLTTQAGLFPGVNALEAAPPDEVWKAFELSYSDRRNELLTGLVLAPGDLDENDKLQPEENAMVDGRLRLTPPCRFCSFGLLCGHGLGVDLGTEGR